MAMIGMSAIVPFLPLFVRELGITELHETASWSGLVFAGPFFVSFFLTPVWGSLGDKYGRKIMTLRAIFGLALAQFLIGFAQNVEQLFVLRLLQGGLSGFLPAAMALVAANTPEDKTGYALGVLQSSTAAGTVLGPLIGGLLSDIFGYRSVFFIVSVFLIVTGILLIVLVREEKRKKEERLYNFIENWKLVLTNKKILLSAALITLTAFGIAFVRPIFVLYIETFSLVSDYMTTITGALYSIVGITSTIGAYYWGKRVEKTGIKQNLITAAFLTGVMYLLHWFVENVWLVVPVRIILGFGFGALLPLLFTSISNRISRDRKGGVLGVGSSFQIIGNMTGPLTGGFLTGILGVKATFIFTGSIFLLISLITYLWFENPGQKDDE